MNKTATTATCLTFALAFAGQVNADGNRYDRDRVYHSEIGATAAYFAMKNRKEYKINPMVRSVGKPVLVDVRSMEEYAAGHPEDSYNVPYPRVCASCATQDPVLFYWQVYDLVKGDTERLVMTLCRTGSRSIDAANILADPENTAGDPRRTAVPGGIPFTNVRNIWEGFVGQYKYAYDGGSIAYEQDEDGNVVLRDEGGIDVGYPDGQPVFYPLDLDNNDDLDEDTADVYEEIRDRNPDKDGWRNLQGLPWSTTIRRPQAYLQDLNLYDTLTLTPVD
jgi:rhodanese-related sulfurtransferase